MAESAPKKTREKPRHGRSDAEYEDWYTSTPDPWASLATLQPGGDRTLATSVRSIVVNAEPAQRPAMEARLLAALQNPACTDTGRHFVARMLALIGSAKCVPVVAKLLEDPKTADTARYALDNIADPSVDAAYRAALDKLSGPAKAGLIGSIGLRGDKAALAPLAALQKDAAQPSEIRAAAERAVARLSAAS